MDRNDDFQNMTNTNVQAADLFKQFWKNWGYLMLACEMVM